MNFLLPAAGDVHAERPAGERQVVTMVATIALVAGGGERDS